jgi:DNA repair protein SbcC/Rad50
MKNYRDKLSHFEGRRQALTESRDELGVKMERLEGELNNILEAQTILQMVAQKTQEELKYHIESIVSMALDAVFPEPYEFEVSFEIKANRTVAECWFVRDGQRVDPMSATGGGAVDIASFALRVVFWSLLYKSKKIRPLLVLDEPFRFVSRDLQQKAGMMMKELSDKLGVQFIMVTHNKDLIDAADRVHEVSLKDGISKVTE